MDDSTGAKGQSIRVWAWGGIFSIDAVISLQGQKQQTVGYDE